MNEHFEPYASEAFGPETMLTASIAISLKRLADHFTLEGKPGGESARAGAIDYEALAEEVARKYPKILARLAEGPPITPTDGETSPDHPDNVVTNAEGGAGAGEAPLTRSGWKLVPVEPTEEMIQAGHIATTQYGAYSNPVIWPTKCYRAMLAASPTPPEPDEGMVGWKWFAKKGGWV